MGRGNSAPLLRTLPTGLLNPQKNHRGFEASAYTSPSSTSPSVCPFLFRRDASAPRQILASTAPHAAASRNGILGTILFARQPNDRGSKAIARASGKTPGASQSSRRCTSLQAGTPSTESFPPQSALGAFDDATLAHQPVALCAQFIDLGLHPGQQLFRGLCRNARPLEVANFSALPVDLAAHMFDLTADC